MILFEIVSIFAIELIDNLWISLILVRTDF